LILVGLQECYIVGFQPLQAFQILSQANRFQTPATTVLFSFAPLDLLARQGGKKSRDREYKIFKIILDIL
jgi:hypothetical protein